MYINTFAFDTELFGFISKANLMKYFYLSKFYEYATNML